MSPELIAAAANVEASIVAVLEKLGFVIVCETNGDAEEWVAMRDDLHLRARVPCNYSACIRCVNIAEQIGCQRTRKSSRCSSGPITNSTREKMSTTTTRPRRTSGPLGGPESVCQAYDKRAISLPWLRCPVSTARRTYASIHRRIRWMSGFVQLVRRERADRRYRAARAI